MRATNKQGDISTVCRKNKGSHWFLKVLGVLLLIGIGIGISACSQHTQPGNGDNTAPVPDIILNDLDDGDRCGVNNPEEDTAEPVGSAEAETPNPESSAGGNNEGPNERFETMVPDVQTDADIPALLVQNAWESHGPPEYCPKFEFFPDGKYRVWMNFAEEYVSFDSVYEVYQYSDGLRAISCDISSLDLDDCLWKRVYLVESSEGNWKYQGISFGFTDSFCSFAKADSGTVPAPIIYVESPNVAAGYYEDSNCDELTINWSDSGKVNFDFEIYRCYGFEDQTGFCTPDGSVYCYLSVGDYSLDGLVRLTFQEQSVTLEVLTAGDLGNSHFLDDYYVGETFIFN